MNLDSLDRLNRHVRDYDVAGRQLAEGALGQRTSVRLNKVTLLPEFAAMTDADMRNTVRHHLQNSEVPTRGQFGKK